MESATPSPYPLTAIFADTHDIMMFPFGLPADALLDMRPTVYFLGELTARFEHTNAARFDPEVILGTRLPQSQKRHAHNVAGLGTKNSMNIQQKHGLQNRSENMDLMQSKQETSCCT